jgi:hypothetical protein
VKNPRIPALLGAAVLAATVALGVGLSPTAEADPIIEAGGPGTNCLLYVVILGIPVCVSTSPPVSSTTASVTPTTVTQPTTVTAPLTTPH